jgi:hypothetical protein
MVVPMMSCHRRHSSTSAGEQLTYDTAAVQQTWDFGVQGGCYHLSQAAEAKAFFDEQGFVVFSEVMTEEENEAAKSSLVNDLHEINAETQHITSLSHFAEEDLPTSPNHTFRTTCNMAFGRFAWTVRCNQNIRMAFATLHECTLDALACSWDNPFYTPQANDSCSTQNACTQLHWDMNWYYGGEKAPLADELCVQGVYYASATDFTTPTFVGCPSSQSTFMDFCESEHNRSKMGANVLNYMPLEEFGSDFASSVALPAPQRIHVPARGLLLWSSRFCHGNSAPMVPGPTIAPMDVDEPTLGRVAMAICYGPVTHRSSEVQKAGLLMGVAGIRTTHNPAIMLAHDKHGYPDSFVSNSEPNANLRPIKIPLNPCVTEEDFKQMMDRAALTMSQRQALSLETLQEAVYASYWGLDGRTEADAWLPMLNFDIGDLRTLMHPIASSSQGLHTCEAAAASH